MTVGHWEMELEPEAPRDHHLWFMLLLTAAGWGAFFLLGYAIVSVVKTIILSLGAFLALLGML